jgi:hypothetical protein
VFALILR